MGKSAGNALWLDAKLTSPFVMYQHFINVADADAVRFLNMLTLLPESESHPFGLCVGLYWLVLSARVLCLSQPPSLTCGCNCCCCAFHAIRVLSKPLADAGTIHAVGEQHAAAPHERRAQRVLAEEVSVTAMAWADCR